MSTPDAQSSPIRVEVRRGTPDDHELAAVVAVVTEAYDREAATAVVDDPPVRPGWELSARGLRRPLDRDTGWNRGIR